MIQNGKPEKKSIKEAGGDDSKSKKPKRSQPKIPEKMTQGLVLTATGKIDVQECKSAKEISFEIIDNKGKDYSSKKAL